jgi:hypothetical protein
MGDLARIKRRRGEDMDIGLYHVRTLPAGAVLARGDYHWQVADGKAGKLFTVDDGTCVHVYERPYGAGAIEIRRAVAVAFLDGQNSALEYRIAGRYPNYRIEEVTATR